MKYFLTAIWAFICMIILILSHSYWIARTTVQADKNESSAIPILFNNTAESSDGTTNDELIAMTNKWPELARQQLEQALKKKKPFKILFVGSAAIGTTEKGPAKEAADQLVDAFGSKQLTTAINTYDETSKEFVEGNNQLEIAAEKAQLIIFEPFILNDNGKVEVKDSLANLSKIMEDVKVSNPNTTFILQPSFPLYQAKFYPIQVEELKKYAEKNNLTYLDHWTAWPSANKAELKDYLLPDSSGPNERGTQIWSQFIVDYLISR